MARSALNTYLEPEQKVRLERIAKRRNVSQAMIVREAIEDYVNRHESEATAAPAEELWERVLSGAYEGDGTANDHDDIYAATGDGSRRPMGKRKRGAKRR